MKKLLFWSALTMMAAVSCNKELENETPAAPEAETVTFIATVDGTGTKTVLGSDYTPMWSGEESITIHDGTTGHLFNATADVAGEATVEFKAEATLAGNKVLAVYPAGTYTADPSAKTVTGITIPADQALTPNTYHSASAVAVAYSEDNKLQFNNAVALLAFQVKNDNVTYGSFYSNNQDIDISGSFNVTLDNSNVPVLSSTNQNHWVNFNIDGTTALAPNATYYIAIAPGELSKQGFSIEFNGYKVKEYAKTFTFKRNVIYNLGLLEDTGFGIVGVVNDWGNTGADIKMEESSKDCYVARNVVVNTEGPIKIRRNNLWTDKANYGFSVEGKVEVDHVYNVLSSGGSKNMILPAGTYDIWLDKANNKVYVMTPGKDISEAKEPTPEEAETATYYLKPNSDWLKDNAWFSAWSWGGSGDAWCNISDTDGDGIYTVAVPNDNTKLKFVRMNPSESVPSWEDNKKWNESADISIPTDGNNLFTMGDGWSGVSGSWSTYSVE